ncbi:MAG: hypothetical protein A3D94_18855 [Alphaproteobacteria bacterium RIFCSPHIGHO2_12_FULL_66_14]|jgi:hypothetical protein|nr:MAG: hypothetical protein A3D94_18855 [Alphaproteobacteria bacterium RIFCSPHIGHO2_12_FULL_66_14]
MAERTIQLCSDEELGYRRSQTKFTGGEGLALDETYRLAHLPLVAPQHPDVIPSREGAFYAMGRHPRVHSLVLPVPENELRQSAAYRELDSELRAAPFAGKIAWDLLPRRRTKLHATICGSLAVGESTSSLDTERRQALTDLGGFPVGLRGPFSGNVNVGRLYLRLYPEKRQGGNVLQAIQRALGCRETDLYLVGLWNLTDDLDPSEAAALNGIIERWWDRPLLTFQADRLWLLAASDDLVLESDVTEVIPLAAPT